MPRFYFHVRTDSQVVLDPDGTELPTLRAARDEAIENARDAMSRAMREGRDLSHRSVVEICDGAGDLLLRVPYADAIMRER